MRPPSPATPSLPKWCRFPPKRRRSFMRPRITITIISAQSGQSVLPGHHQSQARESAGEVREVIKRYSLIKLWKKNKKKLCSEAPTDLELKEKLTPEQYAVLRGKGTEAPFSGKLLHESREGTYNCAACGNPLFASDAVFDRHGLAKLRSSLARRSTRDQRRFARHASRRDGLRSLRIAFGTPVQRRSDADRQALLHEFGLPRLSPKKRGNSIGRTDFAILTV